MKLIRNAIVYSAEIPAADILHAHLAESTFTELGLSALNGAGFVDVPGVHQLVPTFHGGLAFAVRYDEKIIPASAVKAAVEKQAQAFLQLNGRKPGKTLRKEFKDNAMLELCAKALVRTSVVTCLYDTEHKYLIVPTSSQKLADIAVSRLVHAVGSVKTTTIHVSDVKGGLTARFKQWLEFPDSQPFDGFQVGDSVNVERTLETKEKASFRLGNLLQATEGLQEALTSGFQVTNLALQHGPVSFQLTREFRFKGIDFETDPDATSDLEAVMQWQHEAAIQLLEMSKVIQAMCDLLGYKPPEPEAADGNPEGNIK